MEWWIWLWLGVLGIAVLAGAWDDWRSGVHIVRVTLALAAGGVCLIAVLAWADRSVATSMGKWLLPLSILAAVPIFVDARRDLRLVRADPELSGPGDRWIFATVAIGVSLLFGPAIVVGVLLGIAAW